MRFGLVYCSITTKWTPIQTLKRIKPTFSQTCIWNVHCSTTHHDPKVETTHCPPTGKRTNKWCSVYVLEGASRSQEKEQPPSTCDEDEPRGHYACVKKLDTDEHKAQLTLDMHCGSKANPQRRTRASGCLTTRRKQTVAEDPWSSGNHPQLVRYTVPKIC